MKTFSLQSPSSETATRLNVVVFGGTKWNTSEDGTGKGERIEEKLLFQHEVG